MERTEYGNATTPLIGVSEAQQAAFLKDFVTAWQSVEGAGPAYIYTSRDSAADSFDPEANYGLWRADWTAKSAVQVLADLENQLYAIVDGTATALVDPGYSYAGIPSARALFSQVAGFAVGLATRVLAVPRAALALWGSAAQGLTSLVGQTIRALVATIGNVLKAPRAAAAREASVRTVTASAAATTPSSATAVERARAASSVANLPGAGMRRSHRLGNVSAAAQPTRSRAAAVRASKPSVHVPNQADAARVVKRRR